MSWKKRVIFSVISLIWGFISLDYLYFAFSKLTNAGGSEASYSAKGDGLYQLLGAAMFISWFVIVMIYFCFIKKSSNQRDLIEEDYKTGDKKIKKKWFDTTIQAAFIVTGCMLRMAYVMYFILPE